MLWVSLDQVWLIKQLEFAWGPIGPVAPCGPVAPGAPFVPGAPVSPFAPFVPCMPWGPTEFQDTSVAVLAQVGALVEIALNTPVVLAEQA